ncbi:NAD(P)-dependent oxidoreductase [Streptomyces eurythermus]|uniref:NAD(P)-dependent oxidoreductase n=1 Tax=Streptomyces eurythermus TaxID=42237 RepID=UPI0036D216BB
MRTAMIGLGLMGAGMATRLAAAGHTVTGWNRTAERAAPLAEAGVRLQATPGAAARGADVVIVSLADAAAQHGALFGAGGVLSEGPVPGVLVCTSTVAPAEAEALAAATDAVLDVGLLGNHQHARDGQLRLYVGGDAAALDRARPALEPLAQQLQLVGPLGSGMRLKLLMNLLMGIEVQAMAEAAALGARLGLDRQAVLQAITVSGFASPVMRFKSRRLGADSYTDPDFRLRLMAKDLGLAMAESDGLSLPLTAAAHEAHQRAVELGLGDQDCAAISRAVGR